MTQYLRTLLSALALTALVTGTIHATEDAPTPKKVQLASDVWPPFTNEFGKPRLATELTHTALLRSGYTPDTKILDSWTVPSDLKAGKYDGCGAIWKSAEREEYLIFSKPYLESRLHLVGKKGSDVSITDLSSLKGKRIALVKGYAYGPLVNDVKGLEIVYGNDDVENLKMLINDDADYTLVDELLIQYAQKEQPEKCDEFLEFGQNSLSTNSLHLALRKNLPNAAAIIKHFDQAIRVMQADGTYNRVLRLNSIAIDIDDDGVKELVLSDVNLEVGTISGGYDIFSNEKSLPEKKRYSIRDTIYNGWDEVPDDYRSVDDVIPDTRKQGFNLFGGDF